MRGYYGGDKSGDLSARGILGIGNEISPIRGRKGHPGGTGTC